jgi:hypothetical protein
MTERARLVCLHSAGWSLKVDATALPICYAIFAYLANARLLVVVGF